MTTRLLPRNGLLNSPQHPQAATLTPSATSRCFHTTPSHHQADHYATLELSPSASQGEIKKSFYRLSKAHHPDHNPQDSQTASKKFVAISNAYAVLGHPSKRQKYDAELTRARGDPAAGAPSGSYSSASSYSPGGRKASGLSKRRNQFRGPPPSFYRSGGWGANSTKREANMGRDARDHQDRQQRQQRQRQEEGSSGLGGAGSAYSGAAGSNAGFSGGGSSAWPFQTDPNDVAHFDRDGHYRTQTTIQDQLRQGRLKRRGVQTKSREQVDQEDESSSISRFAWVFGCLAAGLLVVPFWAAAAN